MSGTRIKIAFTIVTLTLLGALSATMVVSVGRIFDWLTPVARKDLYWKTQRGVAELGRTVDFGILLRDTALIQKFAADYEADEEVRLFVVRDAQHAVLYRHDKGRVDAARLFNGAPRQIQEKQSHLWSWTNIEVEGERIGSLGLAVSTARLSAGENLRMQILKTALAACLLAVVLSLLFVNFYVGPLIAVTKSAFLELERKTLEALEATRVKSEFLANMSHEIRTPLNGVIGMLGLLIRGELSARQRRRAEISESSARSLFALINDVLDFSKMEAGQHVLHATDCELEMLVRNRIELLAVKAHAKQLEIAYRLGPDVPRVLHVDGERLTQVLTNLVGNAIKFTQEGEVVVTVSVVKVADCGPGEVVLRFDVRDTGPGIDARDQERLFKSFSQVDASAARAHEGTGLGLAISKHLVALMKGEIGLESQPGVGSTFWFTIRCPVGTGDAATPPRAGSPLGRRALIVDSSAMYREVLTEYLSRWGMQVTAAADGDEALALARAAASTPEPFEFAVLDLRLQDSAGGPLAQALTALCGSKLTVIQLTPALWSPSEGQAMEGSIFMAKPVRPSELYDQIANRSVLGGASTVIKRVAADRLGRRRGHILVVDDNEVNRVLAEELLRELGHTCDLVNGGQEAVERACARVYDAILMDCQMPGMNGYQATHEIREREGHAKRRTPIIALTAHAFTGEAQKVMAAGMDDFLTKPVAPRVLDAALQKWMATASTGHLRSIASVQSPHVEAPVLLVGLAAANDSERPSDDSDPGGDRPVLCEQRRSPRLVETFLRTVPAQVEALVLASAGNDIGTIRAHAHKLKGSASSLGALRMAALCEAIQHAADGGDTTQVAGWSQRVAEELALVRQGLDAERPAEQAGSK